MAMTRAEYVALGKRFGSGRVAEEAADALKRWEDDVGVLALYGHGQKALTAFGALVAEHTALRKARPEAIARKTEAVTRARGALDASEAWLARAYTNLDALAREGQDGSLGHALAASRGRRIDGLDAELEAALALCQAHKAALDPDSGPDALVADGTAALTALREALPSKATAKSAPVEDTEEIDYADGRVVERIGALNDAGRKAFRSRGQRAKVSAYKYHHLRARPSDTADDVVAEPGAPAAPT
ncbi:MAG: hypothetical protein HY908_05350 [Myxococcales bacterium]|nr:hypothetical protein [Myxococcales bacterium]